MYVVIDSNIWLSELALNSNSGSAVRFFLRQRNAKLVVPEVVRLEVVEHLRQHLTKFVEDIRTNHRKLLALFGKLENIFLPDEDQIAEKAENVFNDVGVEIVDVPFSFESAQNSLLKTVYKLPPSDKDQQFKDGVIWADCLRLLSEDDVALVTADKGFYRNRSEKSGPAENLIAEAGAKPYRFYLHPSLDALLPTIKTQVEISDFNLLAEFWTVCRKEVNQLLNDSGLERGADFGFNRTLFATQDPQRLYVTFGISIPCNDTTKCGRSGIFVDGDGIMSMSTNQFSEMSIRNVSIYSRNAEGHPVEGPNIFTSGPLPRGHHDVVHSARFRIE